MKTILTICITIMTTISISAQNDKAMPLQTVKDFLTAYMAHDHQKFASYLHPDLVWEQPGNNRISGTKKSRNELLQMGASMGQLSEGTIRLESVRYLDAHDDHVACILHWKAAQPNGAVLDVENIDVYKVRDGQIVQAVIYSSDIAQENAFWGPVP
nr:nuclear transport factor 2 family protein [uncultured Dyadobacter sp.]